MNLAHYLALLHRSEQELAKGFRAVVGSHGDEPDVAITCGRLAEQCDAHVAALRPFADSYGESSSEDEPERLHSDLFAGPRSGSLALLRDLHDLYLMASEAAICWTVVGQAANGLRDRELLAAVTAAEKETEIQVLWLKSRIKQAAPQTLIAAR